MTKNEKEKLTMTLGTIGDCMSLINKYKADYKQAVDKILADKTRTSEFKNEQIANCKELLNKDILSTNAKIKECIAEIRQFVGKPFDLSQNYNNALDYISTMHKAGALNPAMIANVIDEYRGDEATLLYLRTKLSEMGIQTYQFDENMFSTYERDINGNQSFISPTVFFDDLERTIDGGNNNLIAFALGKTEKVLGINSVGINNYISSISRWMQYVQGVGTTLLVTAIALALGVVLGSVVALVRVAHDQQRSGRRNPVLGFFNAICQVYTTIIRGTPMMVQLLIMSMVIFANSRNFTMVGALALGINSGAYVSEIIRGGLMAVDPGQMEAGRSLGLNYITTMVVIIIPQAIRAVLPALGNEFIVLLKDTSLITVIGGKEVLYAAQGIMNRTYEAMFPLCGVALVYLFLVMLFTWLLTKFERRMAQGDR